MDFVSRRLPYSKWSRRDRISILPCCCSSIDVACRRGHHRAVQLDKLYHCLQVISLAPTPRTGHLAWVWLQSASGTLDAKQAPDSSQYRVVLLRSTTDRAMGTACDHIHRHVMPPLSLVRIGIPPRKRPCSYFLPRIPSVSCTHVPGVVLCTFYSECIPFAIDCVQRQLRRQLRNVDSGNCLRFPLS